jgi:hypothetical protein
MDVLRSSILETKRNAMLRNKLALPGELLTAWDIKKMVSEGKVTIPDAKLLMKNSRFAAYPIEQQPK